MTKTSSVQADTNSIQVLLGCSSSILGEGIKKLIEEDSDLKVVQKITSLLDVFEHYKNNSVDIFVVEYELPGFEISKIKNLINKNGNIKILVLLNKDYEDDVLVKTIRAGASGYVLTDSDSSHLRKAVKGVFNNELWVERRILSRVVKDVINENKADTEKIENTIVELTEAESKIVKLVLQGLSNRAIANHLYLSEKTVKFHLYKTFKKLKVKNRSELILYCFKNKLV
ncbi:MAG: response regulator transcription factor [Candidatus Dadabacteria bacterium]|nr:response regulator transcription factor [Candidatus Dadabacteria bacterium]NIV41633.1 response regulator [Candidatus Dadabacteria bacterium]